LSRAQKRDPLEVQIDLATDILKSEGVVDVQLLDYAAEGYLCHPLHPARPEVPGEIFGGTIDPVVVPHLHLDLQHNSDFLASSIIIFASDNIKDEGFYTVHLQQIGPDLADWDPHAGTGEVEEIIINAFCL
jgi:hypothetical protein